MSEQYQVSARKYRPLRFEDVVGQGHIAGTLKNALTMGKVAHAFLFCGPRGVGKTTCARILARTLNCLAPVDNEPCGTCTSCTAFQQGMSFNIVELDAASNNSVEHIRSLTEQVRFAPQSGKYKVFIIDEVHMLTQQAFNAFLKTLEEPPPYAIFILATTEKHKILPTILSRCQIFDFKRISIGDMVLHLKDICKKEGIEAEEEALHVVAQKADGALRDALSIFDRVAGGAQGKLTYAKTIDQLNVLDSDYYFRITDLLLAEDHAEVLQIFEEITSKGFDAELFINGLAEHLRNVLVSKDARTVQLLEVSEGLRARFGTQGQLAPVHFLLSAINLLNECEINFKMARNRRLHTELYLLKIAYIGRAMNWQGETSQAEKKKSEPGVTAAVSTSERPANPEPRPISSPPAVAEPAIAISLPVMPSAPVSTDAIAPKRTSLKKPEQQGALSLDAYEVAVEQEDAVNAGKVSKFGEKAVLELWAAYAEGLDSAILRSNMQLAKLTVDHASTNILVLTHNGVARDMILQEKRLLDHLREALHEPLMRMQVEIDPVLAESAKPQAPTRPLNEREKFDQMAAQNPALIKLREVMQAKIVE